MSWFNQAKKGGSFEDQVKEKIRSSPFFRAMFERFHIPLESLDQLQVLTQPLEDNFCQAGPDHIIIDSKVAERPSFLQSDFHLLAHEMVHWLKRQAEKENYFADPEEIEGFNNGIAYVIWENKGKTDRLSDIFLPLIKIHINDDNKARAFLIDRIKDAQKIVASR